MKNIRLAGWTAAAALAVGAGAIGAQIKDWKFDPDHSEADFAIRHMSISTVHGSFRVIHLDPTDIDKSSVEATIQVASVDTGVAMRDNQLKSAAFFDVAKYPAMTFKSTGVTRSGSGYRVTGDLTLHGVTKQVVLDMETPGKEEADGRGGMHRGFTATTTLNRKDFGLNWEGTLKSGDAALADEVKIELDVEAVQR